MIWSARRSRFKGCSFLGTRNPGLVIGWTGHSVVEQKRPSKERVVCVPRSSGTGYCRKRGIRNANCEMGRRQKMRIDECGAENAKLRNADCGLEASGVISPSFHLPQISLAARAFLATGRLPSIWSGANPEPIPASILFRRPPFRRSQFCEWSRVEIVLDWLPGS